MHWSKFALTKERNTYVVGLFLALLSTTTETKHQVEGRLLLDVVVAERAAILELLAREDQALLVGGDAENNVDQDDTLGSDGLHYVPLLVLDLGLDIVDGVRGLNLEGDGFAREGLYENLHFCSYPAAQAVSSVCLNTT